MKTIIIKKTFISLFINSIILLFTFYRSILKKLNPMHLSILNPTHLSILNHAQNFEAFTLIVIGINSTILLHYYFILVTISLRCN